MGLAFRARPFSVPSLLLGVNLRDRHGKECRQPLEIVVIRRASSTFPLRHLSWLAQPYLLRNLLLRKAFSLP